MLVMFQSVTAPSSGMGQCADSGIKFISMEQCKSYIHLWSTCMANWIQCIHIHILQCIHVLGLHPSTWREWVPRPSHKSLMIVSCLFSIETLNFSTANNSHFYGVVGLRFISIQRSRPNAYCNKKLIQGIKPVIKCKVYVNYFVTALWPNTRNRGTSNGDSGNQCRQLEVRGWHNYYSNCGYSNKRTSPAHGSYVDPTLKPIFRLTESREA
jgi:hypothetical protein